MGTSTVNYTYRYFIPIFTLALCAVFNVANAQDTAIVFSTPAGFELHHKALQGENILKLAALYNVAPGKLADYNKIGFNVELKTGTVVNIPIGAFNIRTSIEENEYHLVPIRYTPKAAEGLDIIGRKAGVLPSKLKEFNNLESGLAAKDNKLFLGWLRQGADDWLRPIGDKLEIAPYDSALVNDTTDNRSEALIQYELQTSNGTNVLHEKGSTVFYKSSIIPTDSLYSAFHNTAGRGTIIKVRNINNGRVVYCKVLGPLPGNKQYFGATLGLSGAARSALGARQLKIYCDLYFAGY